MKVVKSAFGVLCAFIMKSEVLLSKKLEAEYSKDKPGKAHATLAQEKNCMYQNGDDAGGSNRPLRLPTSYGASGTGEEEGCITCLCCQNQADAHIATFNISSKSETINEA